MSSDNNQQPRFLSKTTGVIAGITAFIIAIGGLIAAVNGVFGSWQSVSSSIIDQPDISENLDDITVEDSNNLASENMALASEATNSIAPAPAPLPLVYSKPNGVLQSTAEAWIETDTVTGTTSYFREVSRSDGMTVVFDQSRDLYLRWPNDGGTVQWSHTNPLNWTDLYYATPAT